MNRASDLERLVAHELGHGIFTLHHTFDENYGGSSTTATTDNLMDYAGGEHLAAFQWNTLANPAKITIFDSDDDSKVSYIDEDDIENFKGKWTDLNDNIIMRAYLEDTVKYHIETQNILDGTSLKLQLFDDDKFSFDDDDFDGKEYTRVVNIIDNKGEVLLLLPISWQDDLFNELFSYRDLFWKIIVNDEEYTIDSGELEIRDTRTDLYIDILSNFNNGYQVDYLPIYSTTGEMLISVDLSTLIKDGMVDIAMDNAPKLAWLAIKNTNVGANTAFKLVGAAKTLGRANSLVPLVETLYNVHTDKYDAPISFVTGNLAADVGLKVIEMMMIDYMNKLYENLSMDMFYRIQDSKSKGLDAVIKEVDSYDYQSNMYTFQYRVEYVDPRKLEDVITSKITKYSDLEASRSQSEDEYLPVLIRVQYNKLRDRREVFIETIFVDIE